MVKRAQQSGRPVSKAATTETRSVPRAPDRDLITIRAARGEYDQPIELVVTRDCRPAIERLAREWGYILRVRTRWSGDANLRQDFGERAVNDLKHLGIDRAFIQKIVPAGHVEVELLEILIPVSPDADALDDGVAQGRKDDRDRPCLPLDGSGRRGRAC
jgi:hypothetical protein